MRFFKISLLVALLSVVAFAQGETPHPAWSELPRPGGEQNKGLFLEPALLNMGSRFHLVWSGTNEQIRRPEVFHSTLDGGAKEWKDPRAPFFGKNKARVRKVALGKTRNLIGLVFQRTLTQGNDAYEVLLALSSDQGWSWSGTIEIDSYVADKTGGTAVAIEGRQGSNRPEFAIAWTRAYGDVRTANFDINSSLRPEGSQVGTHADGAEKVGVGTLGSEGFTVVFNNGAGLTAAYIKALIGKVEEGSSLLRGRFGKFFSVASRPYGPSRVVVGSDTTVESLTSDGKDWKKDEETANLPFNARDVDAESDMDDNKNLHVAMIRPVKDGFELWYLGQKDKKWNAPEHVYTFADKVDVRGFDIAASNDYAVIVVSQGFAGKFFRRKL
ncbi:MAG: hypothetical protein WC314_06025 [Vulcanimicrobiota bacterium]